MITNSNQRTARSGIEPYSGAWGEEQAAHLLKRTTYGVKKADLKKVIAEGMSPTIETLLKSGQFPDPPVVDYNNPTENIKDPSVAAGQSWVTAPQHQDYELHRVQSLKSWMAGNMIRQELSIQEKMLVFWQTLIPIKMWSVFRAKACWSYVEMLRNNAVGNYKTLISRLTVDPAMLIFLNGALNKKVAPDENYGRELQELFCIGKGKNAKYTEDDVKAAAKVLTGWTIRWKTVWEEGPIDAYFEFWEHDPEDKQFSSFYDNTVIKGKHDAHGASELRFLLDMIFENEETALYVCRRLYRYFVYSEIDDHVEENVIVPLADIFRTNNYNLKPVLSALLSSAHFYEQINMGAMIKDPADVVVGTLRTLLFEPAHPSAGDIHHKQNKAIFWAMGDMGLELGDPPNVSGYPAHYQVPLFHKAWINTDTILTRAEFTDSIIQSGLLTREDDKTLLGKLDLLKFVSSLDEPHLPDALIREASLLLLGVRLDKDKSDGIKKILLSGQSSDYYWTKAWKAYAADTTSEEKKSVLMNRLIPTFQHFLQLGEAQLT